MTNPRSRHFRRVSLMAILCGLAGGGLTWWLEGSPSLVQMTTSYIALTPIAIGFAAGILLPIGLSIFNVFLKERLYQSLPMLAALIFNLLFDLCFVVSLSLATLWARGQVTELWQIAGFLAQIPVVLGLLGLAIVLLIHHCFAIMGIILGKGNLGTYLLGTRKYPHVLERFVLCVELVEPPSDSLDRNAPRYLGYLNDFYQILEDSVAQYDGELVGFTPHGAILTWPELTGGANNQAVQLVKNLRENLARQAPWFLSAYHTVAQFRAALDFGTVITAEMGWKRRYLTTQGAAMESTQRLLSAAVKLKESFCISEAAMNRLVLPAGNRILRTIALGKPEPGTDPARFYTLEQFNKT